MEGFAQIPGEELGGDLPTTAAGDALVAREFDAGKRKAMANKGTAMPDGSFPIANEEDLHNAIQGYLEDPAHAYTADPTTDLLAALLAKAQIVAHSETQRIVVAQSQAAVAETQPETLLRSIGSSHPCHQCQELAGEYTAPFPDAVWTTHPGCACRWEISRGKTMDYYGTSVEIKTVDFQQRIIAGYAAVHHTVDRVGDIIEPAASAWAVKQIGTPADVGVFIAHQYDRLPMGIPLRIEATDRGLYTETLIKPGPAGDDLLHTAKFLQDHGQPLGLSIGYRTVESKPDRVQGKMIRRIGKYRLKEFSFAAHQTIAHPSALALSVKALTEGTNAPPAASLPSDEKGAGMQYRIETVDGKWSVYCDTDNDGDGDDNRLIGTYASQEMAEAVAAALRGEHGTGPGEGDGEPEERGEEMTASGKTMSEAKAAWTGQYMDTLPDASFLYIEPGGHRGADGLTVPRSLRHLPYKDAEGKVAMARVEAAISHLGQDATLPGVDDTEKASLQARLRRVRESAIEGKTYEESAEWKTGAPLAVRALAYRLLDLSERIASEQKAMTLLGEDTKDHYRIRQPVRDELKTVQTELEKIVGWSATIDAGQDEAAQIEWYRAAFALATA